MKTFLSSLVVFPRSGREPAYETTWTPLSLSLNPDHSDSCARSAPASSSSSPCVYASLTFNADAVAGSKGANFASKASRKRVRESSGSSPAWPGGDVGTACTRETRLRFPRADAMAAAGAGVVLMVGSVVKKW